MKERAYVNGQILVEVLIALSLMAIITSVVVYFGFLGTRATKIGGGQTDMIGLAQEGLEGIEAMAKSNWHSIYNVTGKGSTEYYPTAVSGAWNVTTAPADKVIAINNVSYNRWAIVGNVSRDATTRDIEGTYNAVNDDPSTQKITVNISATGQPNIELIRFVTRARNTSASQTDWSGGCAQATNPDAGFDKNFNTQASSCTNADTSGGSIKLQLQ